MTQGKKLLTTVGENLLKLRKSRRLSQDDLARMIGASRNTVNYIENGKRGFSMETLGALAEALGVSEAELVSSGGLAGLTREPTPLEAIDSLEKWIKALGSSAQVPRGGMAFLEKYGEDATDFLTWLSSQPKDRVEMLFKLKNLSGMALGAIEGAISGAIVANENHFTKVKRGN